MTGKRNQKLPSSALDSSCGSKNRRGQSLHPPKGHGYMALRPQCPTAGRQSKGDHREKENC